MFTNNNYQAEIQKLLVTSNRFTTSKPLGKNASLGVQCPDSNI